MTEDKICYHSYEEGGVMWCKIYCVKDSGLPYACKRTDLESCKCFEDKDETIILNKSW